MTAFKPEENGDKYNGNIIEIPIDNFLIEQSRERSSKIPSPDQIKNILDGIKMQYAGYEIKSQIRDRIEIKKIGITPKETPKDIPGDSLFVYGELDFPAPKCEKHTTEQQNKRLKIMFTYYYKPEESCKVVIIPGTVEESSYFLSSSEQRLSNRDTILTMLKEKLYGTAFPLESFYKGVPIIEEILTSLIIERVGKSLSEDYKEIVATLLSKETKKGESSIADVGVHITQEELDGELLEILKNVGFRRITSGQKYVALRSQELWLEICNLPDGLHAREEKFLKNNREKIAKHLEDNVLLINGIGDFKNEKILIDQLVKETEKNIYIQSIDVGPLFHAKALEVIAKIREETEKTINYRGHIATFENKEVYDYIRKRILTGKEGKPKNIASIVLGNTFSNDFTLETTPFVIFGNNLKSGDKLIVTFEIKPENQEEINNMINSYNNPLFKEFILVPLTKKRLLDFNFEINDIKGEWDDEKNMIKHRIRIKEAFTINYPADKDIIIFHKDEKIRLAESRKFSEEFFESLAITKGFNVVDKIIENGIACFILEKR